MNVITSMASQSHRDNLETFYLVWLDAQVNKTEDNRQTQQELRQIINHLETFDDQLQCYHYIMSLSGQDQLILIVSGQLGRQLIPQIHHLRQLSSIYVFCMDKQANEQWTKKFTKVKCVIVELADLINRIKADQKSRVKAEEPLSIKIYNGSNDVDQSTTELNGHCVHSLLLIDVLIRIKFNETDKQNLITLCRNAYKNNSVQLAIVNEFEHEYTSNKSLWWYTRDSFLYRMLNKALRIQNIELLFLFRFMIGDIYQLLKQNQCRSPVHVYRGQVISNDELKALRQSIGKFISINSFFSTSFKRHKALEFLYNSDISNDLHRILFVINADPRVVKSKPFADISPFSDNNSELEVLFMIGCVFRLIDIYWDSSEAIWIIRIQLCGDDEHNMKKLFNHMKEEYGCGENEVSLQSFGDVLHRMGKYDLAEKIYFRLFNELSPNDPTFSHVCYSLGMVNKDRNEYDMSLQCFQNSLAIIMNTNPTNNIHIGVLYCCIGNVHMKKGHDNEAMNFYDIALDFYKAAGVENHPHMADLYHGIADIYRYRKKYSEALNYYEQSLAIQSKYLPPDHFKIATNHNSIGVVYRYLNRHELAMNHHNQSLEIQLKSLPFQHPDIAMSHKNIALLYESKNEWKQALFYYQKAVSIYRHSLSPDHPDSIELEKDIQRVSSK